MGGSDHGEREIPSGIGNRRVRYRVKEEKKKEGGERKRREATLRRP